MNVRTEKRKQMLDLLHQTGQETIDKRKLDEICKVNGLKEPQWITKDPAFRVSRGVFRIPKHEEIIHDEVSVPQLLKIKSVVTEMEVGNLIPSPYKNFIPFGVYDPLKRIIESKKFYPIFLTGHSGTGKSMPVEQACAELGRKFVCFSMTHETDEGDLLGNYVLIDNQMVWRDGAVTLAARQGAVLLIDEIDYGAQNLGTLQRVIEGRPFLLKKKNEIVTPTEGFTIIATANTKGKGSDDGRYMYTNILNEAFLERFPVTFEQEWAPTAVEQMIVVKEMEDAGYVDAEFAKYLVQWADVIRKTFDDKSIDDVISTRRLVHIARAYGIFRDRQVALNSCMNRFSEENKIAFFDLYSKIDASVKPLSMSTQKQANTP